MGKTPELIAASDLERFADGRLVGEKGATAVGHWGEEGVAMRTTTRRLASAIGLIILASVLAAGCGSGGSTGGGNVGGAAAGEQLNLSGARITVGSREFTEQLILGEIALQALEKAGATVERQPPAWWARMRCARRCILERSTSTGSTPRVG
jgi:hypothetical protein